MKQPLKLIAWILSVVLNLSAGLTFFALVFGALGGLLVLSPDAK